MSGKAMKPVEEPEGALEPESDKASSEEESSLVELLLSSPDRSPPALAPRVDGLVLGRIRSFEGPGAAHVVFPGAPEEGFAARAMVTLSDRDVGQEVALMFEGGDPRRPVIMGRMVSPLAESEPEAAVDGRRVEISADEEIVLRCGESSITLTAAGKIILRGAYLLSRASGVNRIQGGAVEIN